MKKYLLNKVYSLFRGFLISGLCFIIIYPLLLKFVSSFMIVKDVYDPTVYLIPKNVTLDNYITAFKEMNYFVSFINSLLLAIIVSFSQLISSSLVGYGFARYNFVGKKIWFFLVIFILLVPPQLLMIPLFLNFRFFNLFGLIPGEGINLLGSFWPIIMINITAVGLKCGLYIFIMRQYFKGMPTELEDAARVDGAGPFKIFFKIMIPQAGSVLLIVFLFSFVWQWNDLFYTDLFFNEISLLPLELNTIVQDYMTNRMVEDTTIVSIIIQAGIILFISPLLILYSFLQRYFVESIERTGIVG